MQSDAPVTPEKPGDALIETFVFEKLITAGN